MNIETAVKLAKPFIFKRKGRPALTTALVTEEYVIATNTHFLIRIRHNEEGITPYLHLYKKDKETEALEANSYPKTDRLIPDKSYATSSGHMDTAELWEAVECACVAAEFNHDVEVEEEVAAQKDKPKHLKKTKKEIKDKKIPTLYCTDKEMTVRAKYQDVNSGNFTYNLDKAIPFTEKTAFNSAYLKTAIKTFRSAKEKSIEGYFYSNVRPFYMTAGDIEIIILPVRVS